MDIRVYREAMKKAAELGAVIMAHCEDKDLVGKGVLNEGVASEKFGVPGIPNSVEDVITARDIFLHMRQGRSFISAIVPQLERSSLCGWRSGLARMSQPKFVRIISH